MERIRIVSSTIEEALESLPPWVQCVLAPVMAVISHLGTLTAIFAFIIILFQLKVVYINGKIKDNELRVKKTELKLKLLQYEKECIPSDELI
ncbi:MAG: hypothetical protein DRH26_00750 [Deltaproteobacteria bacterium]|nr:MAG: hypothetical protein DRH26_00750 [Deltaproteobacteria bacterium]